ncbi:hypothetical protein [Methylorubrum sp. SB2]|uniref:hypothetical protein n=1 Tax=Methylorubrum subtropicum TaxID=3138812 RepID=UPI00313B03D0
MSGPLIIDSFAGGGGASEAVRTVLLACLPPGVPPSFQEIVSARYVGSGRQRRARAELRMFDGLPAIVEVFIGGVALGVPMPGHQWMEMEGGPCAFEGGRWQRFPEDLDLFTPTPSPAHRAGAEG